MSDVAISDSEIGAELIRAVAGDRGHDEKLYQVWERVFKALEKINPEWTERRVRSLWQREAPVVYHREIREMERAIADRKALDDARRQHAAHIEQTVKLEKLLTAESEALCGSDRAAIRAAMGRMDRSRIDGK